VDPPVYDRSVSDTEPDGSNRGRRARWLVFDLFGDYLRYRGGEVRLQALGRLLQCFDVAEPTTRSP
jgi:DNA-binding transcriptional regulator PaaX